ncbi:MAG: DoxX protein [Alistipes sp.]|nr:DoxX protein [Alistipes sp.]
MPQHLRNRRWFRYLSHFCRVVFALAFIVSGFFKAIDPWGTILSVKNYLIAYDIALPEWVVVIFSIWLCGAELMMGCMLLFKVRIRMVSIFSVLSMTFFTILTLLSATVVPVEDCGCFGELWKLTPWKSFAKNLVLLPMALCFWYRYRPDRVFAFSKLEFFLMSLFFAASMSVGIYSYFHLPPIDMLPYKVGVNIAEEMEAARANDRSEQVVLVYRNRRTGRLREFSLDDKAWHNSDRWEWVDTRVNSNASGVEPMILEFYISNGQGDKTQDILSIPGKLYMLCAMDPASITDNIKNRFDAVERHAANNGGTVIYLTPNHILDTTLPIYNIDAKTMKTMLRANFGLVELENGVIAAKYNYRDIPY